MRSLRIEINEGDASGIVNATGSMRSLRIEMFVRKLETKDKYDRLHAEPEDRNGGTMMNYEPVMNRQAPCGA